MESEKICSVFGHSVIDETCELRENTKSAILRAIESGCTTFCFGGYGRFDALCYEIVSAIKKENENLKIKRVYCVSQERFLRKKVPYFDKEDYDEVIYLQPSFTGWYKSIYFRNLAMIDKSDMVIFCAENRENSGAYKALKYAKQKKGKSIINVLKP